MDRNLDRRVEALVRVTDDGARQRLDDVLDLGWSPDVDHWSLEADGAWTRAARRPGVIDHQRELINRSRRDA
jgi:polyphosphate kinase